MSEGEGERRRICLVGPWRSNQAGGSCCGADPEALALPGGGCVHAAAHDDDVTADRSSAQAVVRTLRAALGMTADVELVDPRNTVYIVPTVYRDARRRGQTRSRAAGEAIRATSPWTLIVDGQIISRASELTPERALSLTNEAGRRALSAKRAR